MLLCSLMIIASLIGSSFLRKKVTFFFNSSNLGQNLSYNLKSPLRPYVLARKERISLLILSTHAKMVV
jgi:hypothetical protein